MMGVSVMFLEQSLHPYSLPLLMGGVLVLVLAVFVWQRRSHRTFRAFVAFLLCEAAWMVGAGFELSASSDSAVVFWYSFKWIAIAFLPVLWLVLILIYTGWTKWTAPRFLVLLLAEPAVTALLVVTNSTHSLLWESPITSLHDGRHVVSADFNGWIAVHLAVSLGFGLASAYALLQRFFRSSGVVRAQTGVLLFGLMLPVGTMVLHSFRSNDNMLADLTPFALSVTTILSLWAFYGIRPQDVSADSYEQIIRSMTDGVLVVDLQQRIIAFNQAAVDIVQPLAAISIGQSIEDVLSDMPQILAQLRTPSDSRSTLSIRREGREIRHIDVSISTLEQSDSDSGGYILVLREVTEDVRNQEEIRILSRAVEQSGSIVIITDMNGNIQYVNPKFTKVTGYTAEEALHRNPRFLKSGESPPAVYDRLWSNLMAGEEWRGEFHNRKKNGELYWVQATLFSVNNKEGAPTHFVAIQEDVTEQKAIRAAEREQRLLAEALQKNSAAITSTVKLDEVMNLVLDNISQFVDVPHDIINLMLLDADGIARIVAYRSKLPHDLGDEYYYGLAFPLQTTRNLREVAETGLPRIVPDIRRYEGWMETEYNRWIGSAVTVPVSFQGKVIGFIDLQARQPDAFSDKLLPPLRSFANQAGIAINNARSFETIARRTAELEGRNRELDNFSHTVAHDLRSPLALVVGYLALVLEDSDQIPPELIQFLGEALKAAENMSTMIESMLLLAQLRSAHKVLQNVDMNPVVASAISRFRVDIEKRGVTIEVQPNLPAVQGYGPWLEEVVANLVSNAIKYIGKDNPDPRIKIQAVPYEGRIRCEIKDNGVGIAPEDQERLFEMFSRFHHGEAGGFGLGLSIVLQVLSKLDGQVGVESTPGEGSTFWFALPVASKEPPSGN